MDFFGRRSKQKASSKFSSVDKRAEERDLPQLDEDGKQALLPPRLSESPPPSNPIDIPRSKHSSKGIRTRASRRNTARTKRRPREEADVRPIQPTRSARPGVAQRGSVPFIASFPQVGLNLGDVPLNGRHVLRPFELSNIARPQRDLRIWLRTSHSLEGAIAFQLSNANLSEKPTKGDRSSYDDYNMLFNLVGHVDSVLLSPGQTQEVVLNFRPSRVNNVVGEVYPSSSPTSLFRSTDNLEHYKFFKVEGTVYLIVLPQAELDGSDVVDSAENNQAVTSFSILSNPQKYVDQGLGLAFPFFARVCQSRLALDRNELLFENCIVDVTYVRSITIWNLSQINTTFSFSLTPASTLERAKDVDTEMMRETLRWFEVTDHSTHSDLTDPDHVEVPGYSHVTLRIRFVPKAVGQFSFDIMIDNNLDESNRFTIGVSASVVTKDRTDTPHLIAVPIDDEDVKNHSHNILSGGANPKSKLDFGNCCTSNAVRRVFAVKNLSPHTLDVHLSTDLPRENGMIVFDLHTNFGQKSLSDDVSSTSSDGGVPHFMSGSPTIPSLPSDSLSNTQRWSLIPSNDRIEEIRLKPGGQKLVVVWFCAELQGVDVASASPSNVTIEEVSELLDEMKISYSPDSTLAQRHRVLRAALGQLRKRKFKIILTSYRVPDDISSDHNQQEDEKQIHNLKATSKVCASILALAPPEINFGDSDIGVPKSNTFQVINISDMPAWFHLSFKSSCVSIVADDKPFSESSYQIEPQQFLSLQVRYMPRKVNPQYRKQVTVVNERNPVNELYLHISGNNIDKHSVWLHSLFYTVSIPESGAYANELLFGIVNANSPAVRKFKLQNVTESDLVLRLDTSLNRELKLVSVENPDVEKQVTEVLAVLNSQHSMPSSFSSLEAEAEYVESWIDMREQINKFFVAGLQPTSSRSDDGEGSDTDSSSRSQDHVTQHADAVRPMDCITLPPHGEKTIYVVYTPDRDDKHKVKLKTVDAKILIHLESYTAPPAVVEELAQQPRNIPARNLQVRAKVCQSIMEIGQSHIQFGTLEKMQRFDKQLSIHNRSEVPLMFAIEKSKAISSKDVLLPSCTMGVIRPYGTRDVPFVFKPTFAGGYVERINVRNVNDPSNSETVVIKANIKRKETFWLQTLNLDFGAAVMEERSRSQKIVLKNISERTRTYCISVDPSKTKAVGEQYSNVRVKFKVLEVSLVPGLSALERDEKLEDLERKLRIAIRKDKKEKAAALMKQRDSLKQQAAEEHKMLEGGVDDDEEESDKKSAYSEGKTTFKLPANALQYVRATIYPIRQKKATPASRLERLVGRLLVYEKDNRDFIKPIQFAINVCYDHQVYLQCLATSPKQGGAVSSIEKYPTPKRNSRRLSMAPSTTSDSEVYTCEVHPDRTDVIVPSPVLAVEDLPFVELRQLPALIVPRQVDHSPALIIRSLSKSELKLRCLWSAMFGANFAQSQLILESRSPGVGVHRVSTSTDVIHMPTQEYEVTLPPESSAEIAVFVHLPAATETHILSNQAQAKLFIYRAEHPFRRTTVPVRILPPPAMITVTPRQFCFDNVGTVCSSHKQALRADYAIVHGRKDSGCVESTLSLSVPETITAGPVYLRVHLRSPASVVLHDVWAIDGLESATDIGSRDERSFVFKAKANTIVSLGFRLVPYMFGPMSGCLVISDLTHVADYDVPWSLSCCMPQWIELVGLVSESNRSPLLDAEQCYVRPAGGVSKVIPFSVRNMLNRPLLITTRSTLPRQVAVYRDSALKHRLVGQDKAITLQANGTTSLYATFKPKLTAAAIHRGECRTLVAGLKLLVVSDQKTSEPSKVLSQVNVRVQAVVGMSIMRVSIPHEYAGHSVHPLPKSGLITFTESANSYLLNGVDLGTASSTNTVKQASVVLTNVTHQLPLHYTVSCSPGIRILSGGTQKCKLENASSTSIAFEVHVTRLGFFHGFIRILNLKNEDNTITVPVSLFVEGSRVRVDRFRVTDALHLHRAVAGQSHLRRATLSANQIRKMMQRSNAAESLSFGDVFVSMTNFNNFPNAPDGRPSDTQMSTPAVVSAHQKDPTLNKLPLTLRNRLANESAMLDVVRSRGELKDLPSPTASFREMRRAYLSLPKPPGVTFANSHARAHATIDVSNNTRHALTLYVLSDVRLILDHKETSARCQKQGPLFIHETPLVVPASGSVKIKFQLDMEETFDLDKALGLLQGFRFPFDRTLLLSTSKQLEDTVAVLRLNGFCCVSRGMIVSGKTRRDDRVRMRNEFAMLPTPTASDVASPMVELFSQAPVPNVTLMEAREHIESIRRLVSQENDSAQASKVMIHVGKIGYTNNWRSIDIECELQNISPCVPLFFHLNEQQGQVLQLAHVTMSPEAELDLDQDSDMESLPSMIPPLGHAILHFTLHTDKIAIGPFEYSVTILNDFNPHDSHVCTVRGEVVDSFIQFSRLAISRSSLPIIRRFDSPMAAGDIVSHMLTEIIDETEVAEAPPTPSAEGIVSEAEQKQRHLVETKKLHLPNLYFPARSNTPSCDAWFSISNVSDEDLEVSFEAQLDSALVDFFQLQAVSRSSNTPLTSLTLHAHDSLDVRVILKELADIAVAEAKPQMSPSKTLSTGKVVIHPRAAQPTLPLTPNASPIHSPATSDIAKEDGQILGENTMDFPKLEPLRISPLSSQSPASSTNSSTPAMSPFVSPAMKTRQSSVKLPSIIDLLSTTGPLELTVGRLRIRSNNIVQTEEEVIIEGSLLQGDSFSVSDRVLRFKAPSGDAPEKNLIEQFSIGNKCSRPLNFEITVAPQAESFPSMTYRRRPDDPDNMQQRSLFRSVTMPEISDDMNSDLVLSSKEVASLFVESAIMVSSNNTVGGNGEKSVDVLLDRAALRKRCAALKNAKLSNSDKPFELVLTVTDLLFTRCTHTIPMEVDVGILTAALSGRRWDPIIAPVASLAEMKGPPGSPDLSKATHSESASTAWYPVASSASARLSIRRATPLAENLYHIDLGQQDLHSGEVRWTIVLEQATQAKDSSHALNYRIYIVDDEDSDASQHCSEIFTMGDDRPHHLSDSASDSESDVDEPTVVGQPPKRKGSQRWIEISRRHGCLRHDDSHSVHVVLSTNQLGIYGTYIIVENVSNHADLSCIRVDMEVVVESYETSVITGAITDVGVVNPIKQPLVERKTWEASSKHKFFTVAVDNSNPDHVDDPSVIHLSHVYFNKLYRSRSLVLTNTSNITLDFVLSSDLDANDPSELYFSLSNSSLKLFNRLYVEPRSSVRVYLHFLPVLSDKDRQQLKREVHEQQFAHDDEDVNEQDARLTHLSRRRAIVRYTANGAVKDYVWKATQEATILKQIQIQVNCQLIKDYQETLFLRAQCRPSQIQVSSTYLMFKPPPANSRHARKSTGSSEDTDNNDSPLTKYLFITNTHHKRILYTIRYVCEHFDIATPRRCDNDADLPFDPDEDNFSGSAWYTHVSSPPRMSSFSGSKTDDRSSHISSGSLDRLEAVQPVRQRASTVRLAVPEKRQYEDYALQPEETHVIAVSLNPAVLDAALSMSKHMYIHEHLRVYNRLQLTEQHFVSLTFTRGRLPLFDMAPGHKTDHPYLHLEHLIHKFLRNFTALFGGMSDKITALYKHGLSAGSTRDAFNLVVIKIAEIAEATKCSNLYFDLRYIVDEMVFYGLKGYVGHFVFKLANMLFYVMMRHGFYESLLNILKAEQRGRNPKTRSVSRDSPLTVTQRAHVDFVLIEWTRQLSYLLNHFPRNYKGTSILRSIERRSVKYQQACKTLLRLLR